MRPKKHIVLFARDLCWADQIRFSLETRLHLKCSEADDPEVVKVLARGRKCDGVVCLGVTAETAGIIDDLPPNIRCLVILRNKEVLDAVGLKRCAIITWQYSNGDMLELLTAVRSVLAKKRGPKSLPKRSNLVVWKAFDAD